MSKDEVVDALCARLRLINKLSEDRPDWDDPQLISLLRQQLRGIAKLALEEEKDQ